MQPLLSPTSYTCTAIGYIGFPRGSDTGLPCSVCRAMSG